MIKLNKTNNIQWGSGQQSPGTASTVNLPITFTTTNYSMVMTPRSSSYYSSYLFLTVTANKQLGSFDYIIKTEPAFAGQVAFEWIAVGY